MEAYVAEDDCARRDRACRRLVRRGARCGEIAFEPLRFGMGRNRGGKLLQRLAQLHRRARNPGKDEKHGEDDGRLQVEQRKADKSDQRAGQSGDKADGEAIAIFLADKGETPLRQLR